MPEYIKPQKQTLFHLGPDGKVVCEKRDANSK